MLTDFLVAKLATATYKLLKDGTYFGSIPSTRGVWVNADSLERCREELKEVLEDWLVFKLQSGESIPNFVFKRAKTPKRPERMMMEKNTNNLCMMYLLCRELLVIPLSCHPRACGDLEARFQFS